MRLERDGARRQEQLVDVDGVEKGGKVKRIRYLGVALVAALSLMAILGSASAGASWIASESSIKAAPSGVHTFSAPGVATIPCTAPSFEVKGPIATKSMDSGSLGDYTACNFFGNTTIKTNGCHLIFRPGAEKSAGVFAGTFEIGPAGCGPLSIEYLGGCKLQFKPKAGLSAEYTNSGSGTGATVTVKLNATGLETVGNSGCGGTGTNGTYTGTYVLSAAQGVHVSEVKFFADGEGSKAKFNASVYPATAEGTLANPIVIKTPEGTVNCGTASLLSTMSAATNVADFKGSLSCNPVFGDATVSTAMNGCAFRFQILSGSSPAWGGQSSIVCENAGEAIKISPLTFGVPICTFSIPAQEIDSTTSYSNWEKGILAGVDREGLTYTGSGGICGSGTQSNANMTASFKLGPGYS